MITTKLRILLVEDVKTDADLITHQLKKIVETFEIKVVDNLADVAQALKNYVPDVILSDYNLPTCTGLEVLKLTQNIDENLPLIFITGTIHDEELAANTILSGASGYILKKHMNQLAKKLEPLLKRVVFEMIEKEELREKVRKNKIAVNQIYHYLDSIKLDNKEQRKNIFKIRSSIEKIEFKHD